MINSKKNVSLTVKKNIFSNIFAPKSILSKFKSSAAPVVQSAPPLPSAATVNSSVNTFQQERSTIGLSSSPNVSSAPPAPSAVAVNSEINAVKQENALIGNSKSDNTKAAPYIAPTPHLDSVISNGVTNGQIKSAAQTNSMSHNEVAANVSSAPPLPSAATVNSSVNTFQQERSLMSTSPSTKSTSASTSVNIASAYHHTGISNYPPTSNYSVPPAAAQPTTYKSTIYQGSSILESQNKANLNKSGWVAPKSDSLTGNPLIAAKDTPSQALKPSPHFLGKMGSL